MHSVTVLTSFAYFAKIKEHIHFIWVFPSKKMKCLFNLLAVSDVLPRRLLENDLKQI